VRGLETTPTRHGRSLALALLLMAGSGPLPARAAAGVANRPPPAPLPELHLLPPIDLRQELEPTAMAPAPAPFAEVPADFLEVPDGAWLEAWLDVPRAFVSRQIFGVVNGFDRFFADQRDLGTTRSRSFIRLRGETRVAEDGTLDFGNNIRADLSLPYIRKRLRRFRIVLENAGRSVVSAEPSPISGQEAGGRADALLRFSLRDTLKSSFDLGAGVLFDIPPGLVGRARFRFARELGRIVLLRGAAVGFWNTRDGFGANFSGALERPLPRRLLLRWTAGTLVSQVSHGYESASELALLATVGRTSAVTLLGSAVGASKPILAVQTWRAAVRLRSSFLRPWIFWELEPELRWPRYDADGTRYVPGPGERRWIPAVFLRLEIQFEEGST